MNFLFFKIGFFSLFLALPLKARAPEDIILEVDEIRTTPNMIRESDVTYTNKQPEIPKEKPEYIARTKFFVLGRSKPNRYGKIMEKIPEGSQVLPFRRSLNKRWIAVKIKKSNLRVWVPETSLSKVDDKKFAVNEISKKTKKGSRKTLKN